MIHGLRTNLTEKRQRYKALLASSIGNSPIGGQYICNKCKKEFGTTAALSNHVRLHSGELDTCRFCGHTTDIHSEMFTIQKEVKIVHSDTKTETVVKNTRIQKSVYHICSEMNQRRHCSDALYRSIKK